MVLLIQEWQPGKWEKQTSSWVTECSSLVPVFVLCEYFFCMSQASSHSVCVSNKGCLNCRGLGKRFFLLLHLDLNGNHDSECFKAKLIGILCSFLLWGAIIESILHEMNVVYLLKLGVKAAYESGLTFLHGKNSSVK